jgi:hypothetical protein
VTISAPSGSSGDPQVIDPEAWEALTDQTSAIASHLCIGTMRSPHATLPRSASPAAEPTPGRMSSGTKPTQRHLATGVSQPANSVTVRKCAVVVDERNPAAEVDWTAAPVRPTSIGHREVAVGRCLRRRRHRPPLASCTHQARSGCPEACSAPNSAHCSAATPSAGTAMPQGRRPWIAASLAQWGIDAERPLRLRREPPGQGRRVIILS